MPLLGTTENRIEQGECNHLDVTHFQNKQKSHPRDQLALPLNLKKKNKKNHQFGDQGLWDSQKHIEGCYLRLEM